MDGIFLQYECRVTWQFTQTSPHFHCQRGGLVWLVGRSVQLQSSVFHFSLVLYNKVSFRTS